MSVTAEVDDAVRKSLTEFFGHVCASRWRGREREAVSLYAFGFLQRQFASGRALHAPGQIGIEVAVPGVGSVNRKNQVCKDLVVWPRAGMTCWGEDWTAVRAPLAILEWKATRQAKAKPSVSEHDLGWLVRFTSVWPGVTGFAVSLETGPSTSLEVARVRRGKLQRGWLQLRGERKAGASRACGTFKNAGSSLGDLTEILRALSGPGMEVGEAQEKLPRGRGLYAIHGDQRVWAVLGLDHAGDGRPLYVGKAERSVLGRDLGTHFGDGRTGASTLRRSLAALLRDRLRLRAIPRNPEKPGNFANYGLSDGDDQKLTKWMQSNLRLSAWPAPPGTALRQIEAEAIMRWMPPLNLTHVVTPWTAQVESARKRMADDARG